MIKRNDPGLGYTVHGDAILLEPHAVQSSQPGDSLVRCRPPRHNLLIHDRGSKGPASKTVNDKCGNAGASQFFRIVDFTFETDASA